MPTVTKFFFCRDPVILTDNTLQEKISQLENNYCTLKYFLDELVILEANDNDKNRVKDQMDSIIRKVAEITYGHREAAIRDYMTQFDVYLKKINSDHNTDNNNPS